MRLCSRFLTLLCVLLPALVNAAETRDITLAAGEVFRLSETEQWRFEVQKEASGRFADVRISPKQGNSFILALYFIADTPDLARLDTPEKIARSVSEGAEKYLANSVEKDITLQAISARGSYGYRTVLTDADPRSAPGGYRYITRGMVRLSPDSALGFSLLSQEINTAAYNRLLNYVYSFIRLAPNSAQSAPAAPLATTVPVARPSASSSSSSSSKPAPGPVTKAPVSRQPRPGRAGQDLRDCLNLPTAAEVARCTHSR